MDQRRTRRGYDRHQAGMRRRHTGPPLLAGLRPALRSAAALVVLAWIAIQWFPVYSEGARLAEDIAQEEATVERLERENRLLRAHSEALDTPRGMEIELRRMGWLRVGELAIRTMPARTRSVAPTHPEDAAPSVADDVTRAVSAALSGEISRRPGGLQPSARAADNPIERP